MGTERSGFKIFDRVFYYRQGTTDEAIEIDPIRLQIKELVDYPKLVDSGLVFVCPNSVAEKDVRALISGLSNRKIIFVNCAENIYGKINLHSHVYALFRRMKFSEEWSERLVLNPFSLRALNIPSPIQSDSYFKHIVREGKSNHYFLLTNDIDRKSSNFFFAPYFYFFCRDRVHTITQRAWRNDGSREFCAFIVSNPNNPDRITFFKKLSAVKQVDSLGKIFRNRQPEDLNREHVVLDAQRNNQKYEQYKFVICFENSYAKGYITEKIVNAIAGGAIPIYKGAPDIGRYFNRNRIIDFADYGSFDAMIEKILQLDSDDSQYRTFINQPIFASSNIVPEIDSHNIRLKRFIEGILNE
jgi:hypothetical protein